MLTSAYMKSSGIGYSKFYTVASVRIKLEFLISWKFGRWALRNVFNGKIRYLERICKTQRLVHNLKCLPNYPVLAS